MSVRLLTTWTLLAAIALVINIGSYPLLDADEGRNAEVGREMAATNDYVVPHLGRLPYLDKPIVYFAAEAAVMEVLGPTELAARLPAWLFTMASAAVLFWFARKVWSLEAGLVAVIAFLSMPLTVAFARTVIFDSALALFIIIATIGFYFAVEASREGEKRARMQWAIVAWGAMGFGVLTKGPVAIALPLLVGIPYAIWRRSFRAIWSIIGVIVFVAVIAPWVWGVQRAIPDFLHYVLVTETAQRLTTGALKRTGPPWYFIPYLLAGALPWSIVLLTSWKEWRRSGDHPAIDNSQPSTGNGQPTTVFLLLWLAIPFIFFSLSQSKRPQYIVPLMAPVALLVAQKMRSVRIRPAAIVVLILGVLLVVAPFLPQFTKGMKPALIAPSRVSAMALGLMFVICGLAATFLPEPRDIALIALSAPLLALPVLTTPIMDAVADRRSTKQLVSQLKEHLSPQTEIIGFEAFTGSMAFYLQRPMIVASDNAEEFTSNYLIRHYGQFTANPGSPLRPVSWLRRDLDACCQPRVYIVRKNDRANCQLLEARGMRILAESAHNLAYGIWRGPNRMPAAGVDAGR